MTTTVTDPALLTLDAGGAVLIAAGLQLLGTIIAGVIAICLGSSYRQQSRLAREQSRAKVHADALRTIHDYLEAPYRVMRRDGTSIARMSLTTFISDIQVRLRYFEELLRLESSTAVADAYAAATAAARSEAGGAISAAWKNRPTKRDKDVVITTRIQTPITDARIREVRELMRKEREDDGG